MSAAGPRVGEQLLDGSPRLEAATSDLEDLVGHTTGESGSDTDWSAGDGASALVKILESARRHEAMDVDTYVQVLSYHGRLEVVQRGGCAQQSPVGARFRSCSDTSQQSDLCGGGITSTSSGGPAYTPGGRARRSRSHEKEPLHGQPGPAARLSPKRLVDRVVSDMEMVIMDVENDYTGVELRLRQDFAANKIRWYGVWNMDLWCFLRNNNPVCSLCFSHYLHPISRKNRISAMALQVLFMLFLTAVLTEAWFCEACGLRSCGTPWKHAEDCDVVRQNSSFGLPGNGLMISTVAREHTMDPDKVVADLRVDGIHPFSAEDAEDVFERAASTLRHDPSLNFCCLCSQLLVLWFYEVLGRKGVVIYAVAANCMFALVVFPLMMCACVQHLSPRFRKLGEMMGYALVGGFAAVMMFWSPFLIRFLLANQLLREFLVNLFISKVASWSAVTLINIGFFSSVWWLQGGPACLPADVAPATVALPTKSATRQPGCCRRNPGSPFHVTAEDYLAYLASIGNAEDGEPAVSI